MPPLILANPAVSLLPAALVALLLIAAAIACRWWALRRAGQSRPFVGLPLAAFLAGPALAVAWLAVDVQFGDYLNWADVPEMLPALLFIGLVAGTLVSGVIWLKGK